ncbi:hypothetical protein HDU86_005183 [Geranomyces michiganensis]|nr:hypothetical protein HDU86_005183 [Geranomyces michiganensis]
MSTASEKDDDVLVPTKTTQIATGLTETRRRRDIDKGVDNAAQNDDAADDDNDDDGSGVAAVPPQLRPITQPKPAPATHRRVSLVRGRTRGGVCTCRNAIACFLVTGSLVNVVGLVAVFWFAYRVATASNLAFDGSDPAAGYPVKPYLAARPGGGFDVFVRVWRTEAEAGAADLFAARIIRQASFKTSVDANISLSLPALGALDPFGMPPISASLAIVPTPHQYSVADVFDMKPDLGGHWATAGLVPPVYLQDVDLVRYLWRPVDKSLPIPSSSKERDTANTVHPSSPHLMLRIPMQLVRESAVYDGIKMERARAEKAAEQKRCEATAGGFLRDKLDCAAQARRPHDALSRLVGAAEQPFERVVALNKLTIGDGRTGGAAADGAGDRDEKVYLPLFVFPFWTLLPGDFVPLDARTGVPVGAEKALGTDAAHGRHAFNITFTATRVSRLRGAVSGAIATLSEHDDEHAPASQFTAFPPRFPNATYSPSSVLTSHAALNVVNHAIATSPLIASSLFAAGMPFIGVPRIVYLLTRQSAVGLSRAGVETELLWAGVFALRQAVGFVAGLHKPEGILGWVVSMSTLMFAAWSWVAKVLVGGTVQNSLLVGLLGVSVTRNLRVRWSRCAPWVVADGLEEEEIKSATEERVPWVHRIALLATVTAIYPLLTTTHWPTSLSAASALYKHHPLVPVGTIAASILQLRFNAQRRKFAGTYKPIPILALLAQASETALKVLWKRPGLPWVMLLLYGWWSVQALMYRAGQAT